MWPCMIDRTTIMGQQPIANQLSNPLFYMVLRDPDYYAPTARVNEQDSMSS